MHDQSVRKMCEYSDILTGFKMIIPFEDVSQQIRAGRRKYSNKFRTDYRNHLQLDPIQCSYLINVSIDNKLHIFLKWKSIKDIHVLRNPMEQSILPYLDPNDTSKKYEATDLQKFLSYYTLISKFNWYNFQHLDK